eukprot:TRINITY_DN2859_c0_g1_i1.p1 TRINITY_DN2859_c0_g1~~TRINITY_DN2859_c0_g1_i1.p1  ORF type:complete len:722 (-),score=235.94 TRINITY_DN2859_c0_g1_i1:152-2317(-)
MSDPVIVNARCSQASPPLSVVLLSELTGVKLGRAKQVDNVEIRFNNGEFITGTLPAAVYLARVGGLYGANPLQAGQVDHWVKVISTDLAPYEGGAAESAFLKSVMAINEHLTLRTYVCGYAVSVADVLLFAALATSDAWASIISSNKKAKYKNVYRLWLYLNSLPAFVAGLKAMPAKKETKSTPHKHGTFEDLKGAVVGKVVTRFPPEPSGFLHIGHAKAAFMNNMYAERYNGEMLVRFDDTNPRKEKEEFEEAILKDLKTMGIEGKKTSHTSDHFELIQSKALEMIKLGRAFCDNSTNEESKAQRDNFEPSPNREKSVEENLKIWEEMKKGTELGATYALRAKIDYKSKNGTMRDPVIYRVVDFPHNRTGDKYKVYPIYNFACPIVDSHEGVTHALRSNEYHDSEEQYYWFLKNIPGLNHVQIKDFGRVDFSYTVLSKRKLQWFVDENIVSGWDDPRFPTVQGIVRRGLTMEALKQFIFDLGDSRKPVKLDILRLWAFNKKFIDRAIPRHTAVKLENQVPLTLDSSVTQGTISVAVHNNNADLGKKDVAVGPNLLVEQEDAVLFKVGEEVTLMGWGNVIIEAIEKDGEKVTGVKGKLNLEGDFKKTKLKITWVCKDQKLRDVEFVEYDTIVTEKYIPKDKVFQDYVNRDSMSITKAVAEESINSLKKGDKLQFNRVGYFILDSEPTAEGPLKFVQIPDGRVKNVYLNKKVVTKGDSSSSK